jgi:hypothetical protein
MKVSFCVENFAPWMIQHHRQRVCGQKLRLAQQQVERELPRFLRVTLRQCSCSSSASFPQEKETLLWM